jgi:hypothetical protein
MKWWFPTSWLHLLHGLPDAMCSLAEAYEDPREPRFRESQPGKRLSTRVPKGATRKFIHIKFYDRSQNVPKKIWTCRGAEVYDENRREKERERELWESIKSGRPWPRSSHDKQILFSGWFFGTVVLAKVRCFVSCLPRYSPMLCFFCAWPHKTQIFQNILCFRVQTSLTPSIFEPHFPKDVGVHLMYQYV